MMLRVGAEAYHANHPLSVVSRTRTQKHIGGIFGLMEAFCNGSVGVSFYACMPNVRDGYIEREELSLTLAPIQMRIQNLVSLLHHSPFCLSIIATVIVIIMIVYCIAFLYFYCRVHRVRSSTTPVPFVRVKCDHFTSTDTT